MRIVAFLPVKLNSQRLKHKNILEIAGHPLCWHLTNTLCNVKDIDEVYVYCSDKEVEKYIPPKAIYLERESYYDGNEVKSFELIGSFISRVDADIYIFANTTSPFLKDSTIAKALSMVKSGEFDSALTVEKVQTFARYRGKEINYNACDIPRTQDMEPVYIETSGFYIFKKDVYGVHHRRVGFKPYLQEVEGIEAVDIDTPEDFELAEALFNYYSKK